MSGDVDGIALASIGAGAIFLYSGITGKGVLSSIQGIVQGKSPKDSPQDHPISPPGDSSTSTDTSSAPTPSAPTGSGDTASNRALMQKKAANYGWTGSEWTALDQLMNRESGYNSKIMNASSGAFGIGQALNHGTGLSKAHNVTVEIPGGGTQVRDVDEYPSLLANSGDAGAQIDWTLSYIHGRYGSPSAAWAHETSYGWY